MDFSSLIGVLQLQGEETQAADQERCADDPLASHANQTLPQKYQQLENGQKMNLLQMETMRDANEQQEAEHREEDEEMRIGKREGENE